MHSVMYACHTCMPYMYVIHYIVRHTKGACRKYHVIGDVININKSDNQRRFRDVITVNKWCHDCKQEDSQNDVMTVNERAANQKPAIDAGHSQEVQDCTVTPDAQTLGNAEGRRGGRDRQVILVSTEHIMVPL